MFATTHMRQLGTLTLAALLPVAGTGLPPQSPSGPPGAIRRVGLPQGFGPQVLTAADFNGDGLTDVALCGHAAAFALLHGDGHGGLRTTPQDARCGEHPSTIAAADLDGDGRIDLAVANHETDYLTVLMNATSGRFIARQVRVDSNPHPHMVATADFNRDGRMDLVTDSWSESRLTLLLATGPGAWPSPGAPLDAGRAPYVNVVAADFDGDGRSDLAFPNAAPTSASNTVSILFGDGEGHFQPGAQSPIAAGPAPFMIALGDVNGDKQPDLLVANYSGHITDTARDGLTWVRNDGSRRFSAFPTRVLAGHGSWMVAAGDVNGDGFADAAFINAGDDTVTLAYGSRDGLRAGPTVRVAPEPHRIALADLDRDGRAEILVTTEARDELTIAVVR
jgi:hypothetical protein